MLFSIQFSTRQPNYMFSLYHYIRSIEEVMRWVKKPKLSFYEFIRAKIPSTKKLLYSPNVYTDFLNFFYMDCEHILVIFRRVFHF